MNGYETVDPTRAARRRAWRCLPLIVAAVAVAAPALSAELAESAAALPSPSGLDLPVGSSTARATGTVSGVVRSAEGGEPLEGVRVMILPAGVADATNREAAAGGGGSGLEAGVTDARGRFTITLSPGAYTLRFLLLGWQPQERALRVDDRDVWLDVRLAASPIPLHALDVLLQRTRLVGGLDRVGRVPGSAHVLTSKQLRSEELLFGDVHGMVRQVPGINVQEEDGYGLRPNIGMRGTGVERSSKVAVLEDGVLAAPAPYAAPAAYYFPVAARMDAIEVRKGSSQIAYGPWTTGGAINLVSGAIPAAFRLDADLAGGTGATRRAHVRAGAAYARYGWLVETYQIRTDGFKRVDGGADSGFDVRDYLVKLRANSGSGAGSYHELELKLGRTDERSDETYLGLTDADFLASPLRRYAASQQDVMNADRDQAQLRYFARPFERLDVTAIAYHNGFDRNWYKLDAVGGRGLSAVLDAPDAYAAELAILRGADSEPDAMRVRANRRLYYSRGLQTTLGVTSDFAGATSELELGVRFHQDAEDRFQHDDGYRMVGGTMVPTSRGVPGSQANRVSEAQAWAFFVQNRLRLGRWSVTPGLRHERIRFARLDYAAGAAARATPTQILRNDVDVWVPGVGITGELSERVGVYAGVHRGFGPPGPGADTLTRAEQSVNYELGARWRAQALSAQVAAFFGRYDDILGKATLASGESGEGELFNGGQVDVKGLELAVEYDALSNAVSGWGLPLRLAYTYTDARFGSSFESEFDAWGSVLSGDRLPYLPEHQLFASARAVAAGWSAGLTATAASAMRTTAGQGPIPAGEGTDAYFVLDASANYRLGGSTTAYAGVQNLLDRSYIVARRPAGARPGLPRTVLAGIRISAH